MTIAETKDWTGVLGDSLPLLLRRLEEAGELVPEIRTNQFLPQPSPLMRKDLSVEDVFSRARTRVTIENNNLK